MYVDSHCHIQLPQLRRHLPDVLLRMRQEKVSHALVVSISLDDAPDVLSLTERHEHLYAAIGVHPGRKEAREPDVDTLVRFAAHPKVLAIGETGLDYYRVQGDRTWQAARFRTHIRASRRSGKPLIIHAREASEDVLRILREEEAGTSHGGYGGIMHCFNDTLSAAQAAMDMGFLISFSGIVTYPGASSLRDVVSQVPLDHLLIETDSPYLSPQAYRGRTNEPAYVTQVAKQIAGVKKVPISRIAYHTSQNFFRLFGLPEQMASDQGKESTK
ncbi:MAG: TatD family hydrolase [Burkholderiaceae bacterium]|jgi:TatD DNase family protein|nr:TatD family hydrolase [Burkholderiaceae bacterium]